MTALLLGYRDLIAARDRFARGLGFKVDFERVDENGRLIRLHVRLGNTVLLLGRAGEHGIRHPQEVGGVTHLVIINVDGDVDEHRERAAEFGLAPGQVVEQPWGREYELRDPEGYVFAFIA